MNDINKDLEEDLIKLSKEELVMNLSSLIEEIANHLSSHPGTISITFVTSLVRRSSNLDEYGISKLVMNKIIKLANDSKNQA